MPNYRYYILDYELYNKELKRIILESQNYMNKIISHDDFLKSSLGFKIDHLTIGNGPNHLIVMGGTHGTEIISVDFVLKLMEELARGDSIFKDFDPNKFTIHFIPLHNPEGFIIVTSMLKSKFSSKSLNEKVTIAKDYYASFKQDDLNANEEMGKLKRHQKMFKHTSYKNIPLKYKNIRLSVKNIVKKEKLPKGSLVDWRSNGLGIELNRNNPFTHALLKQDTSKYGELRYNNLPKNTLGPLGKTSINEDFSFANENININNLLDKLYTSKNYVGLFTYHSTWGSIFYKPSSDAPKEIISPKKSSHFTKINRKIATEYIKYTNYSLQEKPSFEALDELYRVMYPNVLLIELSKMGGNPLGPYGDTTNYDKVIHDNLIAFSKVLPLILKLKKEMYRR